MKKTLPVSKTRNDPIVSEGDAEIWKQTLDQLRLQMPRVAFDTHLLNTTAKLDGNTLTVTTPSSYALEWLENRLATKIQSAVSTILGRDIKVSFRVGGVIELDPQPAPGHFAVSLISFNPIERGYIVTPHYVMRFWQPYLGSSPYILWLTLRSFGYEAGREAWPSIQTLADICFNGNRHRLLGRAATVRSLKQIGAVQTLENECLITAKRRGEGRITSYSFTVVESLPILTPAQVAQLSPSLQRAHLRFIRKSEIDLQEWEKVNVPSLVR